MRSVNTKTYITNYFYGDLWQTKGKKSIDFSIDNLLILKNYLENKKIKFYVVLYPWPFELADHDVRKKYVNYILPKLEQNGINYVNAYSNFLNGDIYTNIFDNYIFNDVHFNKNGNMVLGEFVWKRIFKNIIN